MVVAMAEDGWLTKAEVNALYYGSVGGEIEFATEAQASLYAPAVASLVTLQARRLGRRRLRVLELGANTGLFARQFFRELRALAPLVGDGLERIDYVAVEYARRSLESAVAWEREHGGGEVLLPRTPAAAGDALPEQPTMVALVRSPGLPETNLGLVHAEANQFVRSSRERFDVAILNELLDDLPGRAFYRGADGPPQELLVHARAEDDGWLVRVGERPLAPGEADALGLRAMPPRTVTGRSPEAVELVRGLAGALGEGGMLVVHDYGFAADPVRLATYEPPPRTVPDFARLAFPDHAGDFPRSFYRVFGNERHRLLQVTNDVNFAEIAEALASSGTVVTLPHGNLIATAPGFADFRRGDGVFLSELGLLGPEDDLHRVFVRLERKQRAYRERYVSRYGAGREPVFSDLVLVKE